MRVLRRFAGQRVVEDVREVVDVDAAGGHVGGHEYLEVLLLEPQHHAVALGLRHLAVQGVGPVAALEQLLRQGLRVAARAAKDNAVELRVEVEETGDGLAFVRVANEGVLVLDVLVDGLRPVHVNLERIGHVLPHYPADLARHRGRKEPRAFVFRREQQDFVQLVLEAHVQHLVRLVQHQMPNPIQLHRLALGEVDQATRRGDDHVARLFQLGDLGGDVGPAVHRDGPNPLLVFRKRFELFGDLLPEFARRREHQRLHVVPLGVEVVEKRQAKGGRLAGACLGQSYEIPVSLKQQRNGLRLNVGGRLEAHLGDGFQQGGGEPKGVKCVQKEGESGRKGRPFLSDCLDVGFPHVETEQLRSVA